MLMITDLVSAKEIGFDSANANYKAIYALSSDWAKVQAPGVLKRFNGSILACVATTFPEHAWEMWNFGSSPKSWWQELRNSVRSGDPAGLAVAAAYSHHLYAKYSVKEKDRKALTPLLNTTEHLHLTALTLAQKKHKKIDVLASEFESSAKYRQAFLEGLHSPSLDGSVNRRFRPSSGAPAKYNKLYSINTYHYLQQEGPEDFLRAHFHSNVQNLIMQEFADYAWEVWRFQRAPEFWWADLGEKWRGGDEIAQAVLRSFLDYLTDKYQIASLDGWKSVYRRLIAEYKRQWLHLGSLRFVLEQTFPSHAWKLSKDTVQTIQRSSKPILPSDRLRGTEGTSSTRAGLVSNEQRWKVIDSIRQSLGGALEDLYLISAGHFAQSRAQGWFRLIYGESTLLAIKTECPEHQWQDWRFSSNSPKAHWGILKEALHQGDPVARSVAQSLLEDIQNILGLANYTDWMRLSSKLRNQTEVAEARHRAVPLLSRLYFAVQQLGGLATLLMVVYPHHHWDLNLLKSSAKKSVQFEMLRLLKAHYQNQELLEEATPKRLELKVPEELRKVKGRVVGRLRFDLAIPSMLLVVEYQGEYHKGDIGLHGEANLQQSRDQLKMALLAHNNYKLVTVDSSWDRRLDSLLQLIEQPQ